MDPLLPCRAKAAGVQLAECLDAYLDADAFRRKEHPCYRCPEGLARRKGHADVGDATEPDGRAEPRDPADLAAEALREFGLDILPSAFGEALSKMVGDGRLPLVDQDKVEMPDPSRNLEGFLVCQYATTFVDMLDVVAAAVDRSLYSELVEVRKTVGEFVERTEAEINRRVGKGDIRGDPVEIEIAQAYARRRSRYVANQVIATLDAELGSITQRVFREGGHPFSRARLRFAEQVMRGIAVLEDRRARDIQARWDRFVALLWLASGYYSRAKMKEDADDGIDAGLDEENFNKKLAFAIRRVQKDLASIVQHIPGMGLTPSGL